MNNSVNVRVTAVILLAMIVISGCFPLVFANEQASDPETYIGEQTLKSNNEADIYSDKIYRIKGFHSGLYLSVRSVNGACTVLTEDSDVNSPSQYFRLISTQDGKYILNSAYDNAGCYVGADIPESESNETHNSRRIPENIEISYDTSASSDATALPLRINDGGEGGSVTFSFDYSDSLDLYLTDLEGLRFTSIAETAAAWILEEVDVTYLSMAYFETRVKLYSVQRFYVNVIPSAVAAFVEWTVDNEELMLVSQDGTLCALASGVANLTARVGSASYSCRVEICDDDAFTWFSQENVTNSYWNGGALSGIKFYGKPFASNGAWDWMREGCALTSCAMLFRNLGATYTNGYDFRSNQKGDLPADPYTLALANIGHTGFVSSVINYRKDPVLVRWSNITDAFKVDGRSMSYYQRYTSSLGYIRDALATHPEGVVVRMTKSNGETHFVLFTECINPGERNTSKLKFIVYDPMSYDGSDGDGVPFEKSASYKNGYRYYNISSVIMWNVH